MAFGSTATTTTIAVSPNPVTYPGTTTITVTVEQTSGTAVPGGTATVNVGSTVLFSVTLNGSGVGSAMVPTTGYPAGTYGLTAVYAGNSSFSGSTSSVVNVTLKSPVTVTMQATPNPVAVGQTATLKSTVTATDGGGTPTGTVSFKVGTEVLATVNLSAGTATLVAPTTGYAPGTYPIVAAYNGDTLHATGNSSTTNVSLVSDVSITTTNTPNATHGSPYTETFTGTGGTGSYSWSITSGLSALQGIGMSFSSGGVLSGTPNEVGSYPYTVQVKDTETGETSSAPYTLLVNGPSSPGCGPGSYSVSGTVSYAGSKTGRIYIGMGSSCGGGTQGTSISASGAFTIRGVAPGSYNLAAFMDILGYGVMNAADPTGSSATVTVTDANVTGASITLTDPATVTLSSGPQLQGVSGFNSGAIAFFNDVSNSGGIEAATSYTLQWSTSSSFSSVAGSKTFAADGKNSNVWIVKGLTNGTAYYFRAYGTSGGTAVSPYSSIYGPVTIGAATGGVTVSGSVTFSGTSTGPLYVIFLDQSSGVLSADVISAPVSPQAYSVQVPSGTNTYQFAAVMDQNNDGLVDPGDLQDVAQEGTPSVTISGPTSNVDLTLPSGNGIGFVYTQNSESFSGSNAFFSYALSPEVDFLAKLPVAVTLLSSSNSDGANIVGPIDMANCETSGSNCGHGFQFNYSDLAESAAVGDTYTFSVTYSDGSTGTLTYSLPAVLNAYAGNLAPVTGSSSSTTPTFTWTDPTDAASYAYQFQLYVNGGESVWQIGDEGSGNGFASSITSITWGTDPTGEGSTPSLSSLSDSVEYGWAIQIIDTYGNTTFTRVNYQP
jgi:hypothetical protein